MTHINNEGGEHMAPLKHSQSFCCFSNCFNDHILLDFVNLGENHFSFQVSLTLSSFHSGWVLIEIGQISLEMRHSQPFPEIFKLESFLKHHPRSTMEPHSLSLSLLFTWTRSNMLSFTLKMSRVKHIHLLLFFSEPRFWAKTHPSIQLGELRILALVTGLNLTLVLKLQSLCENEKSKFYEISQWTRKKVLLLAQRINQWAYLKEFELVSVKRYLEEHLHLHLLARVGIKMALLIDFSTRQLIIWLVQYERKG